VDNFAAGILPVLPVGILNVCCFILIADIGTLVHFCLPPVIPLCALDLSDAIISAIITVLPAAIITTCYIGLPATILTDCIQNCLPPALLPYVCLTVAILSA
jgi:hypothetical protein